MKRSKLTHSLAIAFSIPLSLTALENTAWAQGKKKPSPKIVVQFAEPFVLPDLENFRSALRTISSNTIQTKHFERNLNRAYKNAQTAIAEDEKNTLLDELHDYIDDHETAAVKDLMAQASVRRVRGLKMLLDKAFSASNYSERKLMFSHLTRLEREQCHKIPAQLSSRERALTLGFFRSQDDAAKELNKRVQEAMAFRRSVFQEQISRAIPPSDAMRVASLDNMKILDEPRNILATLYRLHDQKDRISQFGRNHNSKQYEGHFSSVFGNLTPRSVSIDWTSLTKLIQKTAIRRASDKVAAAADIQCNEVKHIADIVRSRLTDREKEVLYRTGKLPSNYYGLRNEASLQQTGYSGRNGMKAGVSMAPSK